MGKKMVQLLPTERANSGFRMPIDGFAAGSLAGERKVTPVIVSDSFDAPADRILELASAVMGGAR